MLREYSEKQLLLMSIRRVVTWYDKDTNRLVGEMDATHIDIAVLRQIFNPPPPDPFLYRSYEIDVAQSYLIEEWMPVAFDFEAHIYQLDCFRDG
jgi:hypothetical protein